MRSRRGRAGGVIAGILRVLVVLAVVSVVVLDPLTSTSQTIDTASVRSYDVAMSLSEDGALDSLERVVVQMPPGKRGIFRIFDTADPRRSGVEHPVRVESVERDGQEEPYVDVSSAAGTRSMRQALANLFAVAEAYPDLKASTNFSQLQTELSRTEDQLAFARQYYNDACATLNRTMVTIPWSFFAGMSGVARGEFYDAPAGTEAPPQVSF